MAASRSKLMVAAAPDNLDHGEALGTCVEPGIARLHKLISRLPQPLTQRSVWVGCPVPLPRLGRPLLGDLDDLATADRDPEHPAAGPGQARELARVTGMSWLLPASWLAVMLAPAPTGRVRSRGLMLRV